MTQPPLYRTPLQKLFKIDALSMKTISNIVLPAAVELGMSSIFGMVDLMMVGKFNTNDMVSIGLSNNPTNVLIAIFSAVNAGTTTLAAWKIGAGDPNSAGQTMKVSMILNAALGLMLTIVGILAAPFLINFMASEDAGDAFTAGSVAFVAKQVFIIVTCSTVFQALSMSITSALRGAGETKIPMIYNIAANLFNVVGNYILIFGKLGFPAMGAVGAAISTSLSKIFAFVFAMVYLSCSRKSVFSFRKIGYRIKFDWNIVKGIFKIGLPAAGESIIMQSGFMLYASVVASLGVVEFAAHQIGMNISGLFTSLTSSFSVATNALTGQCIGADDHKLAKFYTISTTKVALFFTLLGAVLLFFFSNAVAFLYNDDPYVISRTGMVLKIEAFSLIPIVIQQCLSGSLRGAGDTKFPMYAAMVSILGLRVILTYLAIKVLHLGLMAAWWVILFDQCMRAVMMSLRYRSGKWKDKQKQAMSSE